MASTHQMSLSLVALVLLMTVSAIQGSDQDAKLPEGKIVGGRDTTIEEYPWQVSLEDHSGSHQCGGSVLAERWVMSAGHCFMYGYTFVIRSSTSYRQRGGLIHNIKSYVTHELYNKEANLDYDIALIKIKEPFVWTKQLQPIRGIATEVPAAGSRVTTTGWGRLYTGGPLPEQLQELTLTVQDWKKCKQIYEQNGITCLTHRKICTIEPHKGTCHGDSGGPIVDAETKEQVAIVSSAQGGCANLTLPTLHTSMAALRGWVREKTGV